MVRLLTKKLSEAGQAALKADNLELDREAWNLPRAPVDIVSHGAYRDRLDWNRFRDLYYPDSRRHNFEAIVAYGAYRKSLVAASPASEPARPK